MIAATGFFRLGFVTELLSRPTRLGYLTGIALTIVVGQIPKMLGFTIGADDLLDQVEAIADAIGSGAVDPVTAAVGASALIVIAVLGRWAPRLPATLIVVIGGIAAVALLDLAVDTVGVFPRASRRSSCRRYRVTCSPS